MPRRANVEIAADLTRMAVAASTLVLVLREDPRVQQRFTEWRAAFGVLPGSGHTRHSFKGAIIRDR